MLAAQRTPLELKTQLHMFVTHSPCSDCRSLLLKQFPNLNVTYCLSPNSEQCSEESQFVKEKADELESPILEVEMGTGYRICYIQLPKSRAIFDLTKFGTIMAKLASIQSPTLQSLIVGMIRGNFALYFEAVGRYLQRIEMSPICF